MEILLEMLAFSNLNTMNLSNSILTKMLTQTENFPDPWWEPCLEDLSVLRHSAELSVLELVDVRLL